MHKRQQARTHARTHAHTDGTTAFREEFLSHMPPQVAQYACESVCMQPHVIAPRTVVKFGPFNRKSSAPHPPRGRALPLSLSLSLSLCITFFARPVSQARVRGASVCLDNFVPHPFTGNLHRLILARKPDKSRHVPSVPLHHTSNLGQAALVAIIFGVVGHDTIAISNLGAVHGLRICTRLQVLKLWVEHAFVSVVLEDKLAEQHVSVTAQSRRGFA